MCAGYIKWLLSWRLLVAFVVMVGYHLATNNDTALFDRSSEGTSVEDMCEETGSVAVVDPHFQIVDTEVHLNDPSKIPRRGSIGLEFLYWVPAELRTLVVGLATFNRAALVALNGEESTKHFMDTFDETEFAQISRSQNLSHFICVESTSMLAPSGQESNPSVHLVEAKWLSSRCQTLVASAGGETTDGHKRSEYLSQVKRLRPFRGIRWTAAFTESPVIHNWVKTPSEGFHSRQLKSVVEENSAWLELVEVFVFFPQLKIISHLAKKFPRITFVVSHLGGPVLCGRPIMECDEYLEEMDRLTKHQNIILKVSGLVSFHSGINYRSKHPDAETLQADWGELIHWLISKFGHERVVFGSNFPIDSPMISYDEYWNAIKLILRHGNYSEQERVNLLSYNAKRIYKLVVGG